MDAKDKIVFLEDVGERPYRVDGMLNHLVQSGALEHSVGQMILTAVGDKALGQVPREKRDAVRADILKQVLILQV